MTIETFIEYTINTRQRFDTTHEALEHASANGMFADQLPSEWEDVRDQTTYEILMGTIKRNRKKVRWLLFTDEEGEEQDLLIKNIYPNLVEIYECWDDDNYNTNLKVLVRLTISTEGE